MCKIKVGFNTPNWALLWSAGAIEPSILAFNNSVVFDDRAVLIKMSSMEFLLQDKRGVALYR